MKCDELKSFIVLYNGKFERVYKENKVDDAIAELKADNERLKKCEIWMKQHFYCEEVIACESAKNRKLKRALWIARAWRAESVMEFLTMKCRYFEKAFNQNAPRCDVDLLARWAKIVNKCRAKAEEYK